MAPRVHVRQSWPHSCARTLELWSTLVASSSAAMASWHGGAGDSPNCRCHTVQVNGIGCDATTLTQAIATPFRLERLLVFLQQCVMERILFMPLASRTLWARRRRPKLHRGAEHLAHFCWRRKRSPIVRCSGISADEGAHTRSTCEPLAAEQTLPNGSPNEYCAYEPLRTTLLLTALEPSQLLLYPFFRTEIPHNDGRVYAQQEYCITKPSPHPDESVENVTVIAEPDEVNSVCASDSKLPWSRP